MHAELFAAHPVLIHAHYSRLTFAMLKVAMLRNVLRQISSCWKCSKILGKNLANAMLKA